MTPNSTSFIIFIQKPKHSDPWEIICSMNNSNWSSPKWQRNNKAIRTSGSKHYLSQDIWYWVSGGHSLLFRALFQNIDHLLDSSQFTRRSWYTKSGVFVWIQNTLDYNFPCMVNKNEWAPMVWVFTKEWTISPFLL